MGCDGRNPGAGDVAGVEFTDSVAVDDVEDATLGARCNCPFGVVGCFDCADGCAARQCLTHGFDGWTSRLGQLKVTVVVVADPDRTIVGR